MRNSIFIYFVSEAFLILKISWNTNFFFSPLLPTRKKLDSIKKDVIDILESLGGKMAGEFSDIGKRKLAYPIKRNTHAFFSFVRFELEDENRQNIPEIGKRLGLYGKIMRHIIVRADEIGKPMFRQGSNLKKKKPGKTRRKKRKTASSVPARKANSRNKAC